MFSRPPLGSTAIFGIPWYSILIVTAVIIGIVLATREEKRLGLPKDTIIDFALLAIPLALIGGRVYYVAFRWDLFFDRPLHALFIWEGGMAIYGAVLGGLLAAWIVAKRRNLSFGSLLDACAPALALGQAIGRWGNYANMEAYGSRITDAAFQFFPLAVEIPIGGQWYWQMATFFYESIWCAIVFALLMVMRKRLYRKGDVVLWYALLYSAGRAVIEGLRTDSLTFINEFVRISQVLSAIAALAVLIVFFVRLVKASKARMADYVCWGIAGLSLVCAFLGEFERGAYQSLFLFSQILCAIILALDAAFLFLYIRRARAMNAPAIAATVGILSMALLLIFGIGRASFTNVAFVSFRQCVCLLHMVLCGAWFYLRAGAPRKSRRRRTQAAQLQTSGNIAEEGHPVAEAVFAEEEVFVEETPPATEEE